MAEISRRYIDKYWVVPVRKLFYFHHWFEMNYKVSELLE